MATKYWVGNAAAVAQVDSGSIDSVDATPANNTFTVTIGTQTVAVAGDTNVATTAANLLTALQASTHPYFTAITWTNPSGGTITGTAATAGVPFTAALTVSGGGTGTVTDFANSTASAGPSHFDTALNWAGGVAPVGNDDIVFENSSINVCWGLTTGLDFDSITVKKTFTGEIGLPSNVFTTTADGDTNVATAPEYRETYLVAGGDVISIGFDSGIGSPAGSSRIKINNDQSAASTCTVHGTSTSSDTNRPAFMYLANHANADLFVRDAPGGVGIGIDAPGETATLGDINILADDTTTEIQIGDGVTFTNLFHNGGVTFVEAAATVTKIEINGGEVTTEGAFAVTTIEVNGGTLNSNSTGTITNANVKGGLLNMLDSNELRTVTTLSQDGGSFALDDAVVTVSNVNEPVGRNTITVSPAT